MLSSSILRCGRRKSLQPFAPTRLNARGRRSKRTGWAPTAAVLPIASSTACSVNDMEDPTSNALRSAATLRLGLEEATHALIKGDLPRLLECEAKLQFALSDLSSYTAASLDMSDATRHQLADDIAHARTALVRCRRHGQALNEFVRVSLAALGVHEDYGPKGAGPAHQRHTIHRTA